MKPETYYCRGLPYSANLPTEVKIRYLGLACPYLVIGFSTLIPRHGFNPVPMNFDCSGRGTRTPEAKWHELMRLARYQLLTSRNIISLLYKNYAKLTNFRENCCEWRNRTPSSPL